MTAQNTFENAVEAMKRGAFDYLTKPFELGHVDALVEKARQQGDTVKILTGVKAGERGPEGRFPGGTINRLVEDKLRAFAERTKGFAKSGAGEPARDGE